MKDTKYKYLKRFLALVLSAAIIITYMPTSLMAYASDETNAPAATEQAAQETKAEETTAPEAKETTAPETAEPQASTPAADEQAAPEASVTEEATPAETPEKAEADKAAPEEETFPAQTFNANKGGVKVLVKAPKGALPEGTEMVVTPANTKAVEQAVSNAVDGEVTGFKAVDITFVKDGEDIEPQVPVQVYLNASGLDKDANKSVVHIEDNGKASVVEDATVNSAGIAKVVTDQFSVYAVVGTDDDINEETARRTYKFQLDDGSAYYFTNKAGKTVDYQIVKNGDKLVAPEPDPTKEVTDDKGGAWKFDGWYNGNTKVTFGTVSDIGSEDETVPLKAKFSRVYYVHYYDTEYVINEKKVQNIMESQEVAEGESATVDSVQAVPLSTNQKFAGWSTTKDAEEVQYKAGDSLGKMTGDIELYPVLEAAYWIHYHSNGDMATYTAPSQFFASEETVEPEKPSRVGYKFDTWCTDKEGETPFTWGNKLSSDVDLYARWTPTNTKYTVLVWQENPNDDNYSYLKSIEMTGMSGEQTEVQEESYPGFHLYGKDADETDDAYKLKQETILGDGSTLVNVYYNRNDYKVTFYRQSQGTSTEYVEYTGWKQDGNYYIPDGDGYTRVYLYEHNNRWYRTRTGRQWWNYEYSDEYTGKVYTTRDVQKQEEIEELTITAKYGQDIANQWPSRRTDLSEDYPVNWKVDPDGDVYQSNQPLMPEGGASFYYVPESGSYTMNSNYRIQTLDGGNNYTIDHVDSFKSNNTNWHTTSEDYYDIAGFTVNYERSTPVGGGFTSVGNRTYEVNIYYDRNKYKVDFDLNGAPGTASSKEVYYQGSLKGIAPKEYVVGETTYKNSQGKEFVFTGWYENNKGEGTPFDFDSSTMQANNIKLYAGWEEQSFEVNIDPNGGELSKTESTWFNLEWGKTIQPYNDVTRNYVESENGDYYYHVDVRPNETAPKVRKAEYSKDPSASTDGKKYASEEHAYQLIGWYDADTDKPYNFDSGITKNTNLVAKWKRVGKFTVTIFYNDAEGNPQTVEGLSYSDQATAVAPTSVPFTPEGKTLVGWTVRKTGAELELGEAFTVDAATMSEKDEEGNEIIEIDPVFEANTKLEITNIEFDANGGTGKVDPKSNLDLNGNESADNNKVELPSGGFTKEGYELIGWSTQSGNNTVEYILGGNYAADGENNTLYAVWAEKINVTVEGNQATEVYDGSEKSNATDAAPEGYTVTASGKETTDASSLVDVTVASSVEAPATGTDAGEYPMGLSNDTVTAALKGETKTIKNYGEVVVADGKYYVLGTKTVEDGKLTITPITDKVTVTITENSGSEKYDGSEKTVTGYTVSIDNEMYTEADFTFGGNATVKGTDAGSYPMELKASDFTNTNENFSNVEFVIVDGTLEIAKRTVELTSEGGDKVYDGTALTKPGVTVGGDGFVEKDVEEAPAAVGTITEVGKVLNEITYKVVEEALKNYDITKNEGWLEVTPVTDKVTVTITENSGSEKYDGTKKTVTGYTVSIDNELYTEADFTFNGNDTVEGTDAGSYPMELKASDFTNTNENFSNVEFVIVDGTLEIAKRSVVLTSETDSKPYDGTALTKPEVTVTGDGFVDGEVSDIKATGTITEAGSVPNTITYTEGENFKADNYDISKEEGTLTITQSEDAVTVTPASDSKPYDGTPLTKNEAEVTGVPEGFTYEVTTKGSITDVGTADNEVDTFKILKDGKDVTDQFSKITKGTGTLEVTKRPVTLTSETDSKPYDGTALTRPEVTVGGDGFVDGEVSDIKATGTITEVGSVTNTITYTEGKDFNADNYTITKTEGTLTITQSEAAITVTPASDSKPYDGTPLTKNEAEVTGVPEGFTYEVTTKGSVTDVGTADNEVDTFKILKDGKDVTDQFSKITKGTGTLEVTKRPVTLTSETASKPYDGTALTRPEVTVGGEGFVEGEVSDIKATGTITEVGSVPNTITYTEGENFKADNYTITKDEGTLTITQNEDEIVVVPANGNKVYDGEALTKNEATVTGVPEGFTYEVTTKGSITDVGTADNEVDTFKVLKDGKDVTNQFKNINTEAKGTLEVTKRPVTLTSESASKPYDGTALTRPEVTVGGDGFVEGEVSDIKATGSITKVGSVKNTITYTEGEKFKAGNYEIDKTEGTLTITKSEAAITVTPASDSRKYDGTPLTKNEAEVTGVPEGFTYEVTTKGSVTDAGKADNEVDTFKILKDGDDVTDQFAKITKNKGTLEVTKRPATITSASAKKPYDGKPLTKHEVTVDGFVDGEGLSEVKVTGTQTYVGSSDNTFEYKLFGDNIFRKLLRAITIKDTDAYDPAAEGVNKTTKADNYDITVKYGTLTVTDEGVDIDDVTTKTHEDKEYKLGETVTFTIEVTNIYDKVKTITVTEQEGVKITSDSVFKDVKPGEKVTATAEYVVTEEDILAGSFNNTATVKFSDVDKPYEPEDKVDVEDPKGHVTITKVATSKPANGKAYKTGEKVTYKITVTNDGNISVKDVEVRDDLTGDVWNVDSIAPGKSEVFNAVYTVTKEDAKKGSVSNIATATGTTDDPDNPNPTIVPGKTTVTTDVPEEPATGGKGVKTGDDNNIPGAIGGFFASLAALFGAVYVRRRKNSEE